MSYLEIKLCFGLVAGFIFNMNFKGFISPLGTRDERDFDSTLTVCEINICMTLQVTTGAAW